MSQFGQFSNAGPSSFYESDPIDHLPNLESDAISIIAGSSSNQRTIALTPVSEFTSPPTLPPTLERFGPDRKKLWIKYTEMHKDDFIIWWLQTECSTKTGPNQKRMRWDTKHSADIWQHFDQVAHHITGEPMVMCRRCGKTLPHPQKTANGTNSMKRHFEAGKCVQAGNSATRQQTLQQSIKYAVYINLLSFI
jgi:hypothetical protein